MRFGLQVESTGVRGDPRILSELAQDAEASGWDGFFVSDPGYPTQGEAEAREICDVWIALTAVAMSTERIHIGTLLTPLPRYRPYEVALRAASLDRLSGGRLSLTVGPGSRDSFERLGEETSGRVRVAKLRESLDIVSGLWTGKPVSYEGEYFRVSNLMLTPIPLQRPRIPTRVCAWDSKAAVALAAQWDGVHVPHFHPGMTCESRRCPSTITDLRARLPVSSEIALEGLFGEPESPPGLVREFADAGVAWWMEGAWWYQSFQYDLDALRARVRKGPPQL